MNNVFAMTGGLKPGRSVFDLSYEKLFDCNAGALVPVLCDEMVPGDLFDISNEIVVRLQPLVAPVLHQIDISVHYFFVPYRILWNLWESFITGGVSGTDASVLPRWNPGGTPVKGRLWDYLGFPLVNLSGLDRPLRFPLMAYFNIWNEFYRDETLQTAAVISALDGVDYNLKYRDWRKDYFSSALPWQQRGTAPALPVSGTTSAIWNDTAFGIHNPSAGAWGPDVGASDHVLYGQSADIVANIKGALGDNTVDLSSATSVNISELRTSIQVQKWLERNARAGVRYTEFLQEHFGVHPKDERLQRPEYIGGSKQPLIVSEVLKTSENYDTTDHPIGTPQGNLAGHGLSASMARIAKYHAKEYGLVMGLMSIMPKPCYASQGLDRQWLRRSKYDFYFPEFSHLSEQAIEREEIYATTVLADNRTIWGYQGRYDEMRVKHGNVCCNMRDTLNYWHMARTFGAAPALNDAFLECYGPGTDLTRIFAVPSEPGYIVHFGNVVRGNRPMPIMSNPGMMDHF
jgi:hypothetical protein